MERINKAAAVGVVFFSVMLAGFVGMKVDQTTVALLGGAFIGLVVAIPTTVLIMLVGLRKPDADQVKTPPSGNYTLHQNPPEFHTTPVWNRPPQPDEYQQNTIVIQIEDPNREWWELREIASQQLRIGPARAGEMMKQGVIRFLPPAK